MMDELVEGKHAFGQIFLTEKTEALKRHFKKLWTGLGGQGGSGR